MKKIFKRKNPIRKSGYRKPGKHNVRRKKGSGKQAQDVAVERARAAGSEAGKAAYAEYQKEKELARKDVKEEFRRADIEVVTPMGVVKKKSELPEDTPPPAAKENEL